MLTGFYTAAAAMRTGMDQQDIIAHNLANASTPGFKRTSVGFAAAMVEATAGSESTAAASQGAGCVVPKLVVSRDDSAGLLHTTSIGTNLAIDGKGSLVVDTPNGERLTRGGAFRLDDTGRLTDEEGNPVLGQNGPVVISGQDFSVDPDGTIRSSGAMVDRLRVETEGEEIAGRIVQGAIETSNVNTVKEMVAMMTGFRAYEANQKMISSLDQILDKAINQMGKSG